ncbi:restriction system modified-DNA reader domain-containing protein [Georgenia ruanii]|uniref:restriction system modified-DNA reader domain-containing protein n=1 Tax=Georgenia ruanii TaxID=348442 RepID=UPI001265A4F1|nr:hypothetical protein [Georgenia ruanii]
MPFFEFDEGRLVPAQFGRPVGEDLEPDLLQAIRDQVLEVVQRPLFPVSWHGEAPRAGAAPPAPRLTAMDASGQVVTVEVVERLDSAALVSALSLSARNSSLGWTQLGELYPRGVGAFRRDWNVFRESMPPRPAPGPRLILVAGSVADEVRPALGSLTTNGVAVHEVALRQMSSGRRFLEVAELRPHEIVETGRVLAGRPASPARELAASPATATSPATPTSPASPVDSAGSAASAATPAAPVSPSAATPRTPGSPSTAASAASPAAAAGTHAAAREPVSNEPLPRERDGAAAEDLARIAASLSADTVLAWVQLRRGVRHEATLTTEGLLRLASGAAFDDPDLAATAASGRDDVDGWRVWRFGEGGPSLADARAELLSSAGRVTGAGRRRG